jgi:hypothetical protein
MTVRFRKLRGAIRNIVLEDFFKFGVKPPAPASHRVVTHAYEFATSGEKVDAFMEWLGGQEDLFIKTRGAAGIGIVPRRQFGQAIEVAWTDRYVQSAYQQGLYNARKNLQKKGYKVPSIRTYTNLQSRPISW